MIIVRTKHDLNIYLQLFKESGKTIGFVPTMGALHQGHLSLIQCSIRENDFTLVSIFVNPTQFNNKKDLETYPRDEEKDFDLLLSASCDIVFVPKSEEMYPSEDTRMFDFRGIDKVMEGKYRNGHFNGVAQIVSKLFKLIRPNKAYFGRKDFQQFAIIKYLNRNYLSELGIEIISCDTVREDDGLAMSSRNLLLNVSERKSAGLISKILKKYTEDYSRFSTKEMKSKIAEEINKDVNLEVEYVDIVDDESLESVTEVKPGKTTVCIAVYDGKVRLIDNFAIK